MAETRPLARIVFSAIGLGPIGAQTVPWRLITGARLRVRPGRASKLLLTRPGSQSLGSAPLGHLSPSLARGPRPQAACATAQERGHRPWALEQRLPRDVDSRCQE